MDTWWHFAFAAVVLCNVPGGVFSEQVCPTECGCYTYMSFIECMVKNLTSVPDHLPHNATTLDLANNSLTALGDREFSSKGGVNLVTLYLYDNDIAHIEERAFDGLTNLTSVHLSRNNISVLNKDTFKNNLNLDSLYLDNNPITLPSSEEESLLNSPSITILSLDECNLTQLTRGLFSETPNIQALFLDYNRLTTFNWIAFTNFNNLSVLYVRNNSIHQLLCEQEVVASLSELHDLVPGFTYQNDLAINESITELSGNPLQCDCCLTLTTYAMKKRSSSVVGSCNNEDESVGDIGEEDVVGLKQCYVTYMEQYNV